MTRVRRACRAAGLVALVAGLLGGHGATVTAQEGAFSVRARADSVGVQLIATEAPAVSIGGGEVAFVTPATAQSELDSLGSSRAFASAPYPGDLVVSLPRTASGLLGDVGFPVPTYPAYVASAHPTEPEQAEEVGPYAIRAESDADASRSEARVGLSTHPPQVAAVHARTSVARDPESGSLSAEAVTEVAPLSVSQLLRVGDVRATARATVGDDGEVHLDSALALGTITVAGVEVGLTDRGLVLGGSPVLPVDLSSLVRALASAGIEVEYLAEQRTATSVTSAGLRITYQERFPTLGDTTVRLVLGQVSVTVDPGAAVGSGGSDGGTIPLEPAPAGSSSGTGALPPAPSSPGPALPPLPSPRAPAADGSAAPGTPVAAGPDADLSSVYPLLAAGGALSLLGSRSRTWRSLDAALRG